MWVKPWSGQTKDFEIGIYCLFTKHAILRSRSQKRPATSRDVKNDMNLNINNDLQKNPMSISVSLLYFGFKA